MNRFQDAAGVVVAVDRVSTVIYGTVRTVPEITIESITAEVPDIAADLLDDTIDALDGAGLLRRRAEGRLSLNAIGKRAHEEGCVPELVFGEAFILEKYSPAVVHLIVRTVEGDERGGPAS